MKEIRINLAKAEKELRPVKDPKMSQRILELVKKHPWSTQRQIAFEAGIVVYSGGFAGCFRQLVHDGLLEVKPILLSGGRTAQSYAVKKDAMS